MKPRDCLFNHPRTGRLLKARRALASADAVAATSGRPPDDSIASVSEDIVEGSGSRAVAAAIPVAGLGVADGFRVEAEPDDEVYAATEKERAARVCAAGRGARGRRASGKKLMLGG